MSVFTALSSCVQVHGFIFVVDGSDMARVEECRAVLK
jgi:hypothetical protein